MPITVSEDGNTYKLKTSKHGVNFEVSISNTGRRINFYCGNQSGDCIDTPEIIGFLTLVLVEANRRNNAT